MGVKFPATESERIAMLEAWQSMTDAEPPEYLTSAEAAKKRLIDNFDQGTTYTEDACTD